MQKIRLRHVLAASAILVATGGIALAGSGMGSGHGMGRGFHQMFEAMDADGDGAATRAEIEALNATRAGEVDADKDGAITASELLAWREAEREKARTARAERQLARMDADGDGAVSTAEFEAARTWRMARFDRNGDGTIEPQEMARRAGMHGHGHGHGHGHATGR